MIIPKYLPAIFKMPNSLAPTIALRSSRYTSSSAFTDTPNPIPASFLRGGTSKGIFINRTLLPSDRSKWDTIFLGIMGSPDPEHGRQLNGMGGGISSLSKVCVVGAPSPTQKEQGIEAEYTFVQVGIRDSSIDYSGNCGNLSSMIGVFAVDEGICREPRRSGTRGMVRAYNTNTQKIVDTTFPISTRTGRPVPILDDPETAMAGVPGRASAIVLDFLDPAGARTGRLLPTGSPLDTLTLTLPTTNEAKITYSCVDATNPTVFVSHSEISKFLPISDYTEGRLSEASARVVSETLEIIRQSAAVNMGLDPSAQAQPKIAILSAPLMEEEGKEGVDLVIHALSMGVLHKAVPMTVGLCAGVASNIEKTLAWSIVQQTRSRSHSTGPSQDMVRIRHPGGVVDVGAKFADNGTVKSAQVVRTGRRLMKGVVWW